MKNICFISTYTYSLFRPDLNIVHGGAEVQMYNLGIQFANNKNYSVSYIVGDFGQNSIETVNNIKLYKYFVQKDSSLLKIFKLLKSLYNTKADVYITRSLTGATFIIALYCKFMRKKFIYMVAHDNEVDGTFSEINKYGYFFNIITKLAYKMSNSVILQSNIEFEEIQKNYNISKKKLHIIRKGINIRKMKNTNRTIDCIWIGRCKKWKNPEIFIDLAIKNSNLNFCMICPPSKEDDYFRIIKQKAKNIKNLEFISYVTNDKIYHYLNSSLLFILTSKQEGEFPMTILEALSCSTPIISLYVNPDDLINKKHIGYFAFGNFNNMNNTINKFINNKYILKKYQKDTKKYIELERNFKKMYLKLKKIIES